MIGLDFGLKLRLALGKGQVVPRDKLAEMMRPYDVDGDKALLQNEMSAFLKAHGVGGLWFCNMMTKSLWNFYTTWYTQEVTWIKIDALALLVNAAMCERSRPVRRYKITPEGAMGFVPLEPVEGSKILGEKKPAAPKSPTRPPAAGRKTDLEAFGAPKAAGASKTGTAASFTIIGVAAVCELTGRTTPRADPESRHNFESSSASSWSTKVKLNDAASGDRIDRAIATQIDGASIQEVRDALRSGQIRVNGRRVLPGTRAKGGEAIDIGTFVPRQHAQISPAPHLVNVLYEDDTLLVLNKPSGIPTVPLGHLEPNTLLGAAVAHCAKIADAGPPLEGGVVHRLDTGTSGVVVFAKNRTTYRELRDAFTRREIEKTYYALIKARELPRMIDTPIGDLDAVTEVRSVKKLRDGLARVELIARTGRRHQIRIHLSEAGAPIIGDDRYGEAGGRLMLHAARVKLPSGLEFEAPLPEEMK